MSRVLLAALLAAVVLMVWGFVWWVASPLRFQVMQPLPDQAGMTRGLQERIGATGVYVFPFVAEGAPEEVRATMAAQHRAGPIGMLVFRKEGAEMEAPAVFLQGFIHFFVSALLVGVLLHLALPALRTYARRLAFVFLAGLFAAIAVGLSSPIWMFHPWGYALFNAAYVATGWLLAGAVMAAVVRPALAGVTPAWQRPH